MIYINPHIKNIIVLIIIAIMIWFGLYKTIGTTGVLALFGFLLSAMIVAAFFLETKHK
jgi:hypothetical protein